MKRSYAREWVPSAVSPKGVLFHAEICHPARRGRGGGLVGLLVRRVYLAHGFEAGTGLPISGAPSLWAMVLVSAAVAAALLVLSRGKHRKFDQCYTGAFSPDTTPLLSGALAGAVLLAIGGFLALAAWPAAQHRLPIES